MARLGIICDRNTGKVTEIRKGVDGADAVLAEAIANPLAEAYKRYEAACAARKAKLESGEQ